MSALVAAAMARFAHAAASPGSATLRGSVGGQGMELRARPCPPCNETHHLSCPA
jgi:hypothetical protein